MAWLRYGVGLAMLAAGLPHFTHPGFYVQVFPPWVPPGWALGLVYASGLAEVAVGALLLGRQTYRLGVAGLLGLMAAFGLLHAYHLLDPPAALGLPGWAYALRAGLQAAIAWGCLRWWRSLGP